VVLGAGPTGVEMSQVFARYGVPTVLISPHDRINPKDHPRSSATIDAALRRDGVDIRAGVRATRVSPHGGRTGAHAVDLSDGSMVEGHEILLAIGRTPPLDGLGLETVGVRLEDGQLRPDNQVRIAEGVYVAGDPAGPEMHTHHDVLADTIHPFPTTVRVMGGLFAKAARPATGAIAGD
jgi:pyruvate/2-oxoglutarate dehydrogenase complex dihydrolipoamide dehydrogenase (E3) component